MHDRMMNGLGAIRTDLPRSIHRLKAELQGAKYRRADFRVSTGGAVKNAAVPPVLLMTPPPSAHSHRARRISPMVMTSIML